MKNQKILAAFAIIIILIICIGLAASSWNNGLDDSSNCISPSVSESPSTSSSSPTSTLNPTSTSSPASTSTSSPNPTSSTNTNTNYVAYTTTSSESSSNVNSVQLENQVNHEENDDYTYSTSSVVYITLNSNSISVSGSGVMVSGTTATINAVGTYSISGTLENGQIIIDTINDGTVKLILNQASITSSTNPAIFISNSEKTVIILAENTQNFLSDSITNTGNGTLYSKDDLTICGKGTLTVTGNSNDAIRCNDGLIIKDANIIVDSVDDGIIGKDYIIIRGATISINSTGDGFKSDNDEDADRGYINIETATITITSAKGDGIAAQTDLLINSGTFTITTGTALTTANSDISTKALKGSINLIIDGGIFNINSLDDALHSNGTIIINGGTFEVSTKDDAIHADTYLEINGGSFNITTCYEGVESAEIVINNGYILINSTDDGINAAGGNDGSSNDWMPGFGGQGMARPGGMGTTTTGNYYLKILNGFIYIDALGDGIDINGYIEMSGGTLIINGPTSDNEGPIDYDSSFSISGGTLIAVGSSGMAQAPSSTSTQYSVSLSLSTKQTAGQLITIQDSNGNTVVSIRPTKTYQCLIYSSANLNQATYNLYIAGTNTGNLEHSIYQNGTYQNGTLYGTFTISNIVSAFR